MNNVHYEKEEKECRQLQKLYLMWSTWSPSLRSDVYKRQVQKPGGGAGQGEGAFGDRGTQCRARHQVRP